MTLKHILSLMLGSFMLIFCIGCTLITRYESAEDCIGSPLPTDATDIYVTWDELYRCSVRFSLPAESVPRFIRDFGLEGELQEGFRPFDNSHENEAWWVPDAAVDFAGVRQYSRSRYVLVDKSDNAVFLIYIAIDLG